MQGPDKETSNFPNKNSMKMHSNNSSTANYKTDKTRTEILPKKPTKIECFCI